MADKDDKTEEQVAGAPEPGPYDDLQGHNPDAEAEARGEAPPAEEAAPEEAPPEEESTPAKSKGSTKKASE